jgi:hypothetical protein
MVAKKTIVVLGQSPFHDLVRCPRPPPLAAAWPPPPPYNARPPPHPPAPLLKPRPPAASQDLTCTGQLSYLGTSWRKDVSFAGYGVALQGDITAGARGGLLRRTSCAASATAALPRRGYVPARCCPCPRPPGGRAARRRTHCPAPTRPAGKMLFGVDGVDPARRSRLIELLDIDLYQRLTTMSDGQRRRVQICMGLLKPYDVLLMDEITVDMDVVGRLDLLGFFR